MHRYEQRYLPPHHKAQKKRISLSAFISQLNLSTQHKLRGTNLKIVREFGEHNRILFAAAVRIVA